MWDWVGNHLFAVQRLLSSCSIFSMLEIDKGVHAAREGDHVIHRAILLKDCLQHSPGQPGVEVAQPQVLASSYTARTSSLGAASDARIGTAMHILSTHGSWEREHNGAMALQLWERKFSSVQRKTPAIALIQAHMTAHMSLLQARDQGNL